MHGGVHPHGEDGNCSQAGQHRHPRCEWVAEGRDSNNDSPLSDDLKAVHNLLVEKL